MVVSPEQEKEKEEEQTKDSSVIEVAESQTQPAEEGEPGSAPDNSDGDEHSEEPAVMKRPSMKPPQDPITPDLEDEGEKPEHLKASKKVEKKKNKEQKKQQKKQAAAEAKKQAAEQKKEEKKKKDQEALSQAEKKAKTNSRASPATAKAGPKKSSKCRKKEDDDEEEEVPSEQEEHKDPAAAMSRANTANIEEAAQKRRAYKTRKERFYRSLKSWCLIVASISMNTIDGTMSHSNHSFQLSNLLLLGPKTPAEIRDQYHRKRSCSLVAVERT